MNFYYGTTSNGVTSQGELVTNTALGDGCPSIKNTVNGHTYFIWVSSVNNKIYLRDYDEFGNGNTRVSTETSGVAIGDVGLTQDGAKLIIAFLNSTSWVVYNISDMTRLYSNNTVYSFGNGQTYIYTDLDDYVYLSSFSSGLNEKRSISGTLAVAIWGKHRPFVYGYNILQSTDHNNGVDRMIMITPSSYARRGYATIGQNARICLATDINTQFVLGVDNKTIYKIVYDSNTGTDVVGTVTNIDLSATNSISDVRGFDYDHINSKIIFCGLKSGVFNLYKMDLNLTTVEQYSNNVVLINNNNDMFGWKQIAGRT